MSIPCTLIREVATQMRDVGSIIRARTIHVFARHITDRMIEILDDAGYCCREHISWSSLLQKCQTFSTKFDGNIFGIGLSMFHAILSNLPIFEHKVRWNLSEVRIWRYDIWWRFYDRTHNFHMSYDSVAIKFH